MTDVITIKLPGTNFTYLHRCGPDHAFVVDPGNAPLVLKALERHHLTLKAVLMTHHHWDHVGGAADLQRRTRCELIGAGVTLIPAPDRPVAEGSVLEIGAVTTAERPPVRAASTASRKYRKDASPLSLSGALFGNALPE